jgi:hypothetical protein
MIYYITIFSWVKPEVNGDGAQARFETGEERLQELRAIIS